MKKFINPTTFFPALGGEYLDMLSSILRSVSA